MIAFITKFIRFPQSLQNPKYFNFLSTVMKNWPNNFSNQFHSALWVLYYREVEPTLSILSRWIIRITTPFVYEHDKYT